MTIAHRLYTVMDSDNVLVMDAGRAIEFGHPHELLSNKDGVLYKLVLKTGSATANDLRRIAESSYQKRVLDKKTN